LGASRLLPGGSDRPALAPELADSTDPAREHSPARRWTGRWRAPPGRPAGLQLHGQIVELVIGTEVRSPAPGEPVVALVRIGSAGSRPMLVGWESAGPVRGAWLDRWLAATLQRARQLLAVDARGLVEALVLGRRDNVGQDVRAAAMATGTSHLLALSGLHVALLVSVIAACGLRAITFPMLGAFVLLAGAGAPLVRAACGLVVARLVAATARRSDGCTRLLLVAVAMEVWQPGWLSSLSARLSFLAVAGLLAAARLGRGRVAALLAPCGAFLATWPLVAETFGEAQPLGVLVTPLLVPCVAAVLALGLAIVPTLSLFAVLDGLTGPLLELLAQLLLGALHGLAAILPDTLRTGPPPLDGTLLSLAVVCALQALGWLLRRRHAETAWERLFA